MVGHTSQLEITTFDQISDSFVSELISVWMIVTTVIRICSDSEPEISDKQVSIS